MNDLLHKLAAIIEWCEQHGADEPHRLACEAMEIMETADCPPDQLDQQYARLQRLKRSRLTRSADSPDNHIHPDQAVS